MCEMLNPSSCKDGPNATRFIIFPFSDWFLDSSAVVVEKQNTSSTWYVSCCHQTTFSCWNTSAVWTERWTAQNFCYAYKVSICSLAEICSRCLVRLPSNNPPPPRSFFVASRRFCVKSRDNSFKGSIKTWTGREGCVAPKISIGHFRITFYLFFNASRGAHLFIWKLAFLHMQIKTNFHMKRWAPRLSLKQRPKVIRKWPIVITIKV